MIRSLVLSEAKTEPRGGSEIFELHKSLSLHTEKEIYISSRVFSKTIAIRLYP
jgi:hypothetical protein